MYIKHLLMCAFLLEVSKIDSSFNHYDL